MKKIVLISFYYLAEDIWLPFEVCHQFHECLAPYRLNDFCYRCLLACLIFISVWST